ncbi:MAG: hypothetical protein SFV21_06695 [Rhodospirillaceae bacterium]|nr:hypothetical protein [Rhodospirillaceae bacterium]
MSTAAPVLLTGGTARKKASKLPEWGSFERAIVLAADPAKMTTRLVFEHVSPPEVCPDTTKSFVFKAGELIDGRLYLCSQTEVLVLDAQAFKPLTYISVPIFNDLHHVVPTGRGTYLVVVTGLEMLVEVTPEGTVINEWMVIDQDVRHRWQVGTDFRKVPTTKPHLSHPNFVTVYRDEFWVTRHKQKDAICVNKPLPPLSIEVGHPHDGVLVGDLAYFTTVNSMVVIADMKSRKIVKTFDLGKIIDAAASPGWCRGIRVLDDGKVIVGFSRLRVSKSQEYLDWLKTMAKRVYAEPSTIVPPSLPTRIDCFDLDRGTREWSMNLEQHDMHAVFSIL